MRKICIILTALILVSCGNKKEELASDVAAKVGDKILTQSDLQSFADAFSGSQDSAKIVAEYIEKWATAELLYRKAENNFKSDSEIEKLVEDYRKTLIINRFEKQIIDDNAQIPTEEQIAEYYSQHSFEMKLTEPVLKGALLKIPRNTPQKEQNQLKQDLRKLTRESSEKIEKYSLKNIADYDFFAGKWEYYSKIEEKLPLPNSGKDAFVSNAKFYELNDSTSIYYLTISEYKTTGAEIPLDCVKNLIIDILTEQNNLLYFKNYAQKLYQNGLKKGKLL
jgi:hypothetical protein